MSPTPRPSPVDLLEVTPAVLREWRLPAATGGKEGRGRTLIVGGSAETPGAVILAAEAALRSGAGKLQVATAASVATSLAVAVPEALVRGLDETPSGAVASRAADQVVELASSADSVLVGPGLADVAEAGRLLARLLPILSCPVVIDALALSAVTEDVTCLADLHGRVVLTPNPGELGETLRPAGNEERGGDAGLRSDAAELAERAQAVVSVGGAEAYIAAPDGRLWVDRSGGAGLGISGSGDVRAGLVAGLLARGAEPAQAAVWAAHVHGRCGERLASTVGPLGFLARELAPMVPAVLAEIEH
jgi:ADP-dependent NAD(P)H-hydrate dehydratase